MVGELIVVLISWLGKPLIYAVILNRAALKGHLCCLEYYIEKLPLKNLVFSKNSNYCFVLCGFFIGL